MLGVLGAAIGSHPAPGRRGWGEPELALTSHWEGGASTWEGGPFEEQVLLSLLLKELLKCVAVFC